MNFRTELQIPESHHKITLQTSVLTLGSCFAEVIGNGLSENKIPTLSNPFGTVFNPLSMAKLLKQAIENQSPDENLYVESQGIWFHYDFHSSLWAESKEALKMLICQRLNDVCNWLKKNDFIVFTLGTAFVYRHIATNQIVANCHKTPAKYFEKELLTTEYITQYFDDLLPFLNKKQQIILTVSPVRHTRDTLPLNAVSKSILRLVCYQLTQTRPNVYYFPAYELLLDDLRDYRFYKPDLIHPNEVAETYIFEKFGAAYFDAELQSFIIEWQKIRQALAHRPLQTNSPAHQKFLEDLLKKLYQMAKKVELGQEIAQVEKLRVIL